MCENKKLATFKNELKALLNKYSKENGSNTPDFLLADYLVECLKIFDSITNERTAWYHDSHKADGS